MKLWALFVLLILLVGCSNQFKVDVSEYFNGSASNEIYSIENGALSFDINQVRNFNLSYDPIDFFPRNRIEFQPPPGHAKTSYNNDGLRAEKNFSVQKNRTRIVLLGDSFVWGSWLNDNETVAHYLEKDTGMEVINLGVFLFNTQMEVERFKRKGIKYSPDLVILFYFSNDIEDADFMFRFFDSFQRFALEQDVPNQHYIKNKAANVIDATLDSKANFARFVRKPLVELNQISNSPVLLVTYYSEPQVEEIAHKFGWGFVDLQKSIAFGDGDKWKVWDGHPSAYANQRIAEFLAAYIAGFKYPIN